MHKPTIAGEAERHTQRLPAHERPQLAGWLCDRGRTARHGGLSHQPSDAMLSRYSREGGGAMIETILEMVGE